MLDPRQQFTFGFLQRCAESGLDEAETQAVIEKAAADGVIQTIVNGVMQAPLYGLLGAAGVGAGGGYLAAKLRQGTVDPDEVKKQELIGAYNAFSDKMTSEDQLKPPARRKAPRFAS